MSGQPLTLQFLGAVGSVTGSKYLVTFGDRRILIDAGLFQGEKELRLANWEDFPVPPASISDVILTHAHLDHCGYLPVLVRRGFSGRVWVTDGTRRLAEIVLRDAGSLQERDAEHAALRGYSKHNPPQPLFGLADVERTLPLFRVADFDQDVDLGEGASFTFTRAGHILGAASVRLTLPHTSVLFSGDLGRAGHPVLRPRGTPAGAAAVLVESTYGDRRHPSPQGPPHQRFAAAISRTAARGGTVLVPAYAVDRTEVVLKSLADLLEQGSIPQLPIFVDSPMSVAALEVYRDPKNADELRPDLGAGFLDLPGLRAVRTTAESIKLNGAHGPRIIISASGMATGGRVLHHLEHLLPDPRNTVVLVGYQAVGTRGRQLLEGARQLKLHGRYVPVRAEVVQEDEFSVHADGDEVLAWLRELSPAPDVVYVVHGEPDSARALADRIDKELGLTAVTPRRGEVVRLNH